MSGELETAILVLAIVVVIVLFEFGLGTLCGKMINRGGR